MKKITFLMASAALTLVGATSCSNHDDVYMSLAEQKQAQYDAAFVSAFGQVDPLQDWGFGTATTKAAVTRGVNANANEWCNNYDIPQTISDEEKLFVYSWFRNHQYPTAVTTASKCTFFAQQVYKGGEYGDEDKALHTYKDANGSDVFFNVQNVNCGDSDGGYNWCIANNGTIDSRDVYKYDYSQAKTVYDRKENVALIEDGNPNKWQYTSTQCGNAISTIKVNDNKQVVDANGTLVTEGNDYNVFVLVAIEYNGETNYYVGFDLAANGQNKDQQISPDGYYDDMIIKIVPTQKFDFSIGQGSRVFAEDLGTIGDWDFNDVVFDLVGDKITLRAAGGTLPLYLYVPTDYNGGTTKVEVHDKFGVDTSVMVNTGAGVSKDPVEISTISNLDASQIKITVLENGEEREITALQGEPAAKFAVKKAISWPSERVDIRKVYPGFTEYVQDASKTNWYELTE